MLSQIQRRGHVGFPEWRGERIYMQPLTPSQGLPWHLSRWQSTVDAMLDGIEVDGPVFLMVDQGVVRAGEPHRRGGLHVDGHWIPAIQAWGGGSWGPAPGNWRPAPGKWRGQWDGGGPGVQAIVLASDVMASRAMVGSADGDPGDGGDCSHIDRAALMPVYLEPGVVWAGNSASMLHEALPVAETTTRTVVRLHIPGWLPEASKC